MLTPWLDLPGAESFFRWAGAIADADLLTLGTTGDAEAIRDTAVTQPLVVAMSLFVARELGALPGPVAQPPRAGGDLVVTGHSVGELTAAALAGVLSVEAAIALTAVRGRAMARACALTPTGMSAVLGGDPDELAAALERHGLVAANLNGGGQVVVAGPLDGLAALKSEPPAKARVVPLSVAGAFHTAYMAPAREELEGLVGGLRPADPGCVLLSNADGAAVDSGAESLSRLVSQVTSPVHFDACLSTLRGLGVTAAVELPPAGALAGLAKREWAGAGIEVLALAGPGDLDRARALVGAVPRLTPEVSA
jgi:[acyl-carrier-protein] S-malonyltransferase